MRSIPYQEKGEMFMKLSALQCVRLAIVLVFTSVFAVSLPSYSASSKQIVIGVASGPDAQIAEFAKGILAKKNINLKIVEFNDYVQPNLALDAGDIDANAFQHVQYLNSFSKQHNLKLTVLANTYVAPIGLYSKKVNSIRDLKAGATIAIPNDPTNGGRALLLLEKNGLIKLKNGVGITATPLDIATNAKKFVIKELDAAQTARVLDDVDAAVINTDYAIKAGLNPGKDALIREGKDSPYVNVVAIKAKDKDNPLLKELAAAYNAPEFEKFYQTTFKGAIMPAF